MLYPSRREEQEALPNTMYVRASAGTDSGATSAQLLRAMMESALLYNMILGIVLLVAAAIVLPEDAGRIIIGTILLIMALTYLF